MKGTTAIDSQRVPALFCTCIQGICYGITARSDDRHLHLQRMLGVLALTTEKTLGAQLFLFANFQKHS